MWCWMGRGSYPGACCVDCQTERGCDRFLAVPFIFKFAVSLRSRSYLRYKYVLVLPPQVGRQVNLGRRTFYFKFTATAAVVSMTSCSCRRCWCVPQAPFTSRLFCASIGRLQCIVPVVWTNYLVSPDF